MTDIAAARPVAGQPIETAWGQNVHDAIEATARIWAGTGTLDVSGGAAAVQYATIPYPAFSLPVVTAALVDPGAQSFSVGVVEVTATFAKVAVRLLDGTNFAYSLVVGIHVVETA